MTQPRFNNTQESKPNESHERELAHEVIDALRVLGLRARENAEEAQSVGLRVALSSIGSVCDTWLKALQNALHLSYPGTSDHLETMAEIAISQASQVSDADWRPGENMGAAD